ncbi:phosphoadenylyl-sulfate reductase [Coralloluteibacterium stylophorae]|uniref:Phosphoadenosine 5'-phosphosulfate reductase n=1 Tax=Coralloluteibacterium stylophorae TaxID=1776034 RepID=A0A8J7VUL7_9GAMM|nr:phosphoadenylyl-sulfate reductase [Coralloluteibacterium stylophorae]MBS7456321.1 phosphoadenylyl-sulfate reductase [Coralloluteibacterium stylophorae]
MSAAPHVPGDDAALAACDAWLADRSAPERLAWALATLPGAHVLSSSFGTQAAVSLHMAATLRPDIPVVLIDTGYLFAETYRFADALRERLGLDLRVYRAEVGAAWMEARHGRLWEQGAAGLATYNRIRKVEPMRRALAELGAGTWITGLRRRQARSRAGIGLLERHDALWKLNPLADWSDRDVWQYLRAHDLPYHPLWEQGYVSVGDTHSTRPLADGMDPEDTRFHGLVRECGLHVEI